MGNVAIITARGGSKRLPRKNIREFCGKPIIAYSIEASLKSKVFDRVMVSTEDQEIAQIAEFYGASVPFLRSSQNANDYASTVDVLDEVIRSYQAIGIEVDSFCCIYPTAPFVTSEKLVKGFSLLNNPIVDSVIPIVQYSFPPQRAFVIKDSSVQYQYPQFWKARSQDLEPIYHDCGQFYFCKVAQFIEHKTLILPNAVPMVMSEMEVQDIDTEEDWAVAEMKYNIMVGKNEI